MRLVLAQLRHYDCDLTPAEREQLAAAAFGIPPQFSDAAPEDAANAGLCSLSNWHTELIWELGKVPTRLLCTLHGAQDILDPRVENVAARTTTVVNQRVHVAVPGLGLLGIEEVCVRYDLCTDELARELRDGWRILAICPQPDQRRPDYILGRTAPREDAS